MKDEEFDRLLKICRLELSEIERKRIKGDVDSILEYFDTIEKVDCAAFDPAYHSVPIPERLREDKVVNFKETNDLLKNSKIYRFYVVGPKI